MLAVTNVMNRAYDIEEGRPWWKVRVTAMALTVSLSVFIALAFALIVAGPEMADALAGTFGVGNLVGWGWKILQWPVAFVLVMVRERGTALVRRPLAELPPAPIERWLRWRNRTRD